MHSNFCMHIELIAFHVNLKPPPHLDWLLALRKEKKNKHQKWTVKCFQTLNENYGCCKRICIDSKIFVSYQDWCVVHRTKRWIQRESEKESYALLTLAYSGPNTPLTIIYKWKKKHVDCTSKPLINYSIAKWNETKRIK